jgi:hypothetical protein
VASYPTDALDSDTLVRMADCALYAAKGTVAQPRRAGHAAQRRGEQAELISSRIT